jgi:hypothetical protein
MSPLAGAGAEEPTMNTTTNELQLLVLRAPGAQSDRLGTLSEHLAAEIITASSCPVKVMSAVGNPGEHLPYEYDVLVRLEPADGEIDVEVSNHERLLERFRMPSETMPELREIGRRIGACTARHLSGSGRQNAGTAPRA